MYEHIHQRRKAYLKTNTGYPKLSYKGGDVKKKLIKTFKYSCIINDTASNDCCYISKWTYPKCDVPRFYESQ